MKYFKAMICMLLCCLFLYGCKEKHETYVGTQDEKEVILYKITGEPVNVLESEKEEFIEDGYYNTYKEVLEALKNNLSEETISFFGENYNRLCNFTRDDIDDPEFARTWIFYRFTGIDSGEEPYYKWKKSKIEDEYKLFFGVDIPEFKNDENVRYQNKMYYISSSDPGEIAGKLEKITVLEDCVELTYQLVEPWDGGEIFNSKVIYTIVPADNKNGFYVTSMETKKIDETLYATECLNEGTSQNNVVNKSGITHFSVTEELSIFPKMFARKYCYSSGAGGWRTELTVNENGLFEGCYTDSDMGASGQGYEYTVYECEFQGKFQIMGKIDEHSYYAKLSEVSTNREKGEEWIEDNALHIASIPSGIEDGEYFVLYTPETSIKELNEDFLSWWPLRYEQGENRFKTLSVYGIYNINTGDGFFSLEDCDT